jgi:hypothetical protein
MTVTPVLARKWLKANVQNRRLKTNRVDELADAILRGEWLLDGSTIKFSKTGKLIDGQHRLAAIDKAGRDVQCLVVEGLEEEAQLVTDRGSSRTFGDALYIDGEPNAIILASACTIMWRYENSLFGKKGYGPKVSFNQLYDVLSRHPELRKSVVAAGNYTRKIKMPRSYLGAARTIFLSIDEADTDYFFSELMAGSSLTEYDPIFRLREGLNQNAMSSSKKYSNDHLLALMFKAWNIYRNGEECKNLSYRAGGASPEAFPLPI